jgi:3-keto-5-aminohexanoate cleavage enzyme
VEAAALLPGDATWSVIGVGRHQTPMAMLALAMGGHVRVGLEDNIHYRRGELATGNAQLVERAVRLARELGRPVASAADARRLLGID